MPRCLTTPVAYITTVPLDPFGFCSKDDLYQQWFTTQNYYYATKKYFDAHGWIWRVYPGGSKNPAVWCLQSKGPDKAFARAPSKGGAGVDELDEPYTYEYDPSNGTISTGNDCSLRSLISIAE